MEHPIDSLVVSSAKNALELIVPSHFLRAYIQFWQTWAHMEITVFIHQNPIFPKSLQDLALIKATSDWTSFDENDQRGAPSVVKNAALFENKDYWDPNNLNIIWDDKLWLGITYVALFKAFRVEKYLRVAMRLYDFTKEHNWKPNNYLGLIWKPGGNYKNTITNGLFFLLCCRLFDVTREPRFLESSVAMYQFLFKQQDKYINAGHSAGLFPDNPNADGYFTYNQSVTLEGLLYLVISHPGNSQEFIDIIVTMLTKVVSFFKDRSLDKYICIELASGDYAWLRTAAVFRSFLFRSIVCIKRLLPPLILKEVLQKTPSLRLFVMNNAQAMCKFQNLMPGYRWDKYCDGLAHEYNTFNQFYCLLAAHEIYNAQELVVDGVEVRFDGYIMVDFGQHIQACSISKLRNNDKTGLPEKIAAIVLSPGRHHLISLMNEKEGKEENINLLELKIVADDGSETTFVLVFLESQYSKFGLIPDQSCCNIGCNYLTRIMKSSQEGVSYYSLKGRHVSLSHTPSNGGSVPLRLIIQ